MNIDYTQHPLYSPYIKDDSAINAKIESLFSEVDRLKISHQTAIGRFSEILSQGPGLREDFIPFMKEAFAKGLKRFQRENKLRKTRLSSKFKTSEIAQKQALTIHQKGLIKLSLSAERFLKLEKCIEKEMQELRERAKNTQGALLQINPGVEAHELMDQICQEEKIYETLTTLYGIPFGTVGFTIHYATPRDSWFRESMEFTPPQTAQYHFDLDYEVPKALLYMSDVGPEQGPFSIIEDSHNREGKGFLPLFHKEFALEIRKWAEQNFPVQQVGNESIFRIREVRQLYASLPAALRGTDCPGDHIVDGSSLSKDLLSREYQLIGPKGTYGLFTGAAVLHRGGLAKNGERMALQICFWPLGPQAGKLHVIKRKLRAKASAVKQKMKRALLRLRGVEAPSPDYSYVRFSKNLAQLLDGRERISAVDIGGAADLQPHWHRIYDSSNYIVYEPHTQSYAELIERQKRDPYYKNFSYINEALSETGGARTLYLSNAPTGTSLYKPGKNSTTNYPESDYLYPMRETSISTVPLKESLDRQKITSIDCIKLDTQGSELEILKGLDESRLKGLLLIEMEVGIIDHYDDERAANLSRAMDFARHIPNMDLFDLRCNRFTGNMERRPGDELKRHFEIDEVSPPMAQRLNEVDAIFIVDPRKAIDAGMGASRLKKLIALLTTYNFYSEAFFAINYGCEKGILTDAYRQKSNGVLKTLFKEARTQSRVYENFYRNNEWKNWGQYMEVPYPSN